MLESLGPGCCSKLMVYVWDQGGGLVVSEEVDQSSPECKAAKRN